jgi:hypothetical protein
MATMLYVLPTTSIQPLDLAIGCSGRRTKKTRPFIELPQTSRLAKTHITPAKMWRRWRGITLIDLTGGAR